MKKILLLLLYAFLFSTIVDAQQDAQYTQFMFNKLSYNSAYAGSEGNKICVTGLFRSQWLGFSSGSNLNSTNTTNGQSDIGSAPNTFVGNIHAGIGSHFGVGLNIGNDKIGFENTINPILSVSYRYTFKNSSVLSIGLGGGFVQKQLAGGKLNALDKNDRLIPTGDVTGINADFNLGLYYMMPSLWRFDNFYAGLSATHLNQPNVGYQVSGGTVQEQMRLHTYFMTGATYSINTSLQLEPNILLKMDQAKITTDINVMAMYNNKYRGGLTYRTVDAIAILAGYKFTPELQMGISYDFTTSKIRDFSNGTIEFMLKYCFMPKLSPKPDKQPIPRLTPRFL